MACVKGKKRSQRSFEGEAFTLRVSFLLHFFWPLHEDAMKRRRKDAVLVVWPSLAAALARSCSLLIV